MPGLPQRGGSRAGAVRYFGDYGAPRTAGAVGRRTQESDPLNRNSWILSLPKMRSRRSRFNHFLDRVPLLEQESALRICGRIGTLAVPEDLKDFPETCIIAAARDCQEEPRVS